MSSKCGKYIYDQEEEFGSGGYGHIFIAENEDEIKKGEKKIYILKIHEEDREEDDEKSFNDEIDILYELTKIPENIFTSTIYAFNKFNIQNDEENKIEEKGIDDYKEESNEGKIIDKQHYYVMDYFSKGLLFDYIVYNKLTEKLQKLIFKKIIIGFKFIHSQYICHLDIKPENIILDRDFWPRITDFGFSKKFIDANKKEVLVEIDKGTKQYVAPEIWAGKKFKGDKADIFSLGVILFNLVTGREFGFTTSEESDKLYKLIIKENYELYWTKLETSLGCSFSNDFKELYIQMINPNPDERPKLDKILESNWLKEVINLSKEEEDKLNEQLDLLHDNIITVNSHKYEYDINEKIQKEHYASRGGENNENKLFSDNLRAKKFTKNKLVLNKYIIFGGILNEVDFMNSLVNSISKKFVDICLIEPLKDSLRFKIFFEDDGDENNGDCDMVIELFKYEEKNHLLEFRRTKGSIHDYYDYFEKIKNIITTKN